MPGEVIRSYGGGHCSPPDVGGCSQLILAPILSFRVRKRGLIGGRFLSASSLSGSITELSEAGVTLALRIIPPLHFPRLRKSMTEYRAFRLTPLTFYQASTFKSTAVKNRKSPRFHVSERRSHGDSPVEIMNSLVQCVPQGLPGELFNFLSRQIEGPRATTNPKLRSLLIMYI